MTPSYRLLSVALVVVLAASNSFAADKPLVLNVWPDKAPGEAKDIGPEKYLEQKPNERQVERLTNVSQPTITVYAPPKEKQNGTSVVICPGGGYHILAMDLEGTEVAQWLNGLGVTAIVLKYRVPKREGQPAHQAPLQDAQRAVSLVRSKAKEWNLDEKRIGILGFSAGGHLSAMTSMHFGERSYQAVDDIDKVSPRPDFAILVYPAYLTNKEGTELSPDVKVSDQTPPMFFAHAGDDSVTPMSSVLLYGALKKAGVASELHVYTTGGHGFGLRPSNDACSTWPARCEEWLKARAIIK